MSAKERSAGERVLEGPPAEEKPPGRPPREARGRKAGRRTKTKTKAKTFVVRLFEVVVIVAGLVATAMISAAVTFTLAVRTNEVSVPDLAGTSVEAASERLRLSELQLVVEGNRFHASVPPDFISEQTPAPGTTLKKGRSVRVWVSLGPEKHSVPRIEGETLQSAQLILEQHGFSLGRIVEIHSEIYAPDTVVAQSPQAYEDVSDVTEVSVLLSRGYLDQAYVMPDFIGRNYVDIVDELSRGAVKISELRQVDYPGVAKNVVVRQLPAAGSKVMKRDRIILFVSRGT